MIEKMKILCNNKQFCTAILTDLSKAFDSMPFDLLIANLNANSFDSESLKLIHSYLYDRSQKVGSSFRIRYFMLCSSRINTWSTTI